MKLYAHPNTPRRHPFYTAAAPSAHAYALLHQLLAAYNEVLYTWWSPEDLYTACFGDLLTRPTRTGRPPGSATVAKRIQKVEDRVGYAIPELLDYLHPAELDMAATVFCTQPLPAFILYVLSLERMLYRRLKEPSEKRLNDESHAKAAGLGRDYSQRTDRHPEAPPCTCHQPSSALPSLVLTLPAPATAVRQSIATPQAPVATLTTHTLLYQVKRAQERRRLKRKHR